MYILDVHFSYILPDFFSEYTQGKSQRDKGHLCVFFNDMHFSIFCLNNFFQVITKC